MNHRRQISTLEQDNYAPQMPIYLMWPKWTQAKPSWPKRREAPFCCSIIRSEIYLAVVDWSRTYKVVSLFLRYMAGDSNIWRQHCLQWIVRLCWSAPLDGRVCFQWNILHFHHWHSDTNRSSMCFSEWKSSKCFYTCNINTELLTYIQNSYTKQILLLFRYLVIPIAMG